MARPRIYTDEERKQLKKERNAKNYQKNRDKILEHNAKWRAENPDYYKEYGAKYRDEHKDELAEYRADYNKTPMGRAVMLVNGYQQHDKKYNLGKCTLTSKWVVENIFVKPCHYCGKEGWDVIGCDRIDNSLPHTPGNVVPCCGECNVKRHTKSYEAFVSMLK